MNRKQYKLYDPQTQSTMLCWLDADAKLKVGIRVTLKDIPDTQWLVVTAYDLVVDDKYFHRKWNFDYCEKLTGLKLA